MYEHLGRIKWEQNNPKIQLGIYFCEFDLFPENVKELRLYMSDKIIRIKLSQSK